METARAPLVGMWKHRELGAFLRLGPQPLSVVLSHPVSARWCVGVGVAGQDVPVEWPAGAPSLPFGPHFGGQAFDAARLWPGFAAQWWFVPRLLAWRAGGQTGLAAFGRSEAECEQAFGELCEMPRREAPNVQLVFDDSDGYARLVELALAEIDRGVLSKVVPARSFRVRADAPFEPRDIMRRLEVTHPTALSFLIRGTDGSHFVGATPETLCEVREGLVETEALAGTRPIGREAELLQSVKEREEHALVVDAIRAALAPLVKSLPAQAPPQFKRLATLVHLHTPIAGRLLSGVSAQSVIDALHPTPAVCGTPQSAARAWLAAHENFSRGWYAGVVGARGPRQVSAFVALRSARLVGNEAEVFAGAGVVAGAQAAAEVLETRSKAQAMMSALGVG